MSVRRIRAPKLHQMTVLQTHLDVILCSVIAGVRRDEPTRKRRQIPLSIQRNQVTGCNPYDDRSGHWNVLWIEVRVVAHACLTFFVKGRSGQRPLLVRRPLEHHVFGNSAVAIVREHAEPRRAVTHGKDYEEHEEDDGRDRQSDQTPTIPHDATFRCLTRLGQPIFGRLRLFRLERADWHVSILVQHENVDGYASCIARKREVVFNITPSMLIYTDHHEQRK